MTVWQATLNFSGAQAYLNRIGNKLVAGYPDVVAEANKLSSESVAQNFQASGRPALWDDLAPATVKWRERMLNEGIGMSPIKPLLWQGALEAAATAVSSGPGVDVEVTDWGFRKTLTQVYAGMQNKMRPYMIYQNEDVQHILARWEKAIQDRIAAAETV